MKKIISFLVFFFLLLTLNHAGVAGTTAGYILADSTSSSTAFIFTPRSNCTPTVTLVGGAGNTVPQYTTNTCVYTRLGNLVVVELHLTGDGGNEGAGTGTMNIALPVTASATHPAGGFITIGTFQNNVTRDLLVGQINANATTIILNNQSLVGTVILMTGADQNNTSRTIDARFEYWAD